jgi:bifunctional DNA-binding transcriptional regulator/antitoxin component of YhaV-PrlF toxin-antitoxin module
VKVRRADRKDRLEITVPAALVKELELKRGDYILATVTKDVEGDRAKKALNEVRGKVGLPPKDLPEDLKSGTG